MYKSVAVNGATYQYLYDAKGRRRLRVYPVRDTDEYFYEGGALLEDRGQVSLTAPGNINYTPDLTLDEYVWLGGMPVAVVKTRLTVAFARSTSTNYARNDEYDACGTLYPVSDYLPKVVAMVDSTGKLAGTGEYDVFGKVNEVAVVADTPAYPASAGSVYPFGSYREEQNTVLAYLKQPAGSASLSVQLRVKYAAINTNVGDVTWVEDGDTGALLTNQFFGQLGQKTTGWLPVGPGGLVHVRWQSDFWPESLPNFTGVTVGSYEYRRFETGASPWWVPLRFPGQYADAETGLFENWNRFYDPGVGTYSGPDPLLPSPQHIRGSVYGYASNSPTMRSDRDGREDNPRVAWRADTAQQVGDKCNKTGDKGACAVVKGAVVVVAVAAAATAAATAVAALSIPAKVTVAGVSSNVAANQSDRIARTFETITQGSQITETVVREAMASAPLQSQQAGGLSLPRIQEYFDMLAAGSPSPAIQVDGSMIVDGNHRYVAGTIFGQTPPIQQWAGGRPADAVPWGQIPIDPKVWPH
ncbi:MAG: RHS repeat-associated core domain-containing protein [Myxococcota bacterium]